jgi:hypothetical protein
VKHCAYNNQVNLEVLPALYFLWDTVRTLWHRAGAGR